MKSVAIFLTAVCLLCSACGSGGGQAVSHSGEVNASQVTTGTAIVSTCFWNGTSYSDITTNQACTPDSMPTKANYPYPSQQNSNTACAVHSAQYFAITGIPFVPLITNGGVLCVSLDRIETAAVGTDYETYGYNYYYAYPPYEGLGCAGSVDLGNGPLSVCF